MTCVVGTSDGAELGSAGHEYAHAAMERTLASSGAALPPQWALQDLPDYIKALQEAVPAAVRAVGIRRRGRTRGVQDGRDVRDQNV
jgi:L-ribulokinase